MNSFDYFIILFNGKWILGKIENVNFENVNFVNNKCWCVIIIDFHYLRVNDDDQAFN